jgi:stage III sporulation protein SpoIIIAA
MSYNNESALHLLLNVVPAKISSWVKEHDLDNLLEIVLDVGRTPEIRFPDSYLTLESYVVTKRDIDSILDHPAVGQPSRDNRCGVTGTLHRISCIRDNEKTIVGLTCRVGRSFTHGIALIEDIVASGESVLILGKPGVGKTSKLREVCSYLSSKQHKRLVIVDTSNEIAGEGIVPHESVGRSRRLQIPYDKELYDVMIEAVENHMPEVVVMDEISTYKEAQSAKTIAERGVQLIATAHGVTLANVIQNRPLIPVIGEVRANTISDTSARKINGGNKNKIERVYMPTFTKIVELIDFDTVAIHHETYMSVDVLLSGGEVHPEVRKTSETGYNVIQTLSYTFEK